MLWRMAIIVLVLGAQAGVGCGEELSPAIGSDVTQNETVSRTIDTLLLMLSARVSAAPDSALAEHDGMYIDRSQLTEVLLHVDQQPWGTFSFAEVPGDARPADAEHEGWRLRQQPSQGLVVARLGLEEEASTAPPSTMAEWVAFLQRRLPPGGHVAVLRSVTLRNAAGESLTLEPNLLLPFAAEPGESTALIAEDCVLTLSDLGGAR